MKLKEKTYLCIYQEGASLETQRKHIYVYIRRVPHLILKEITEREREKRKRERKERGKRGKRERE